ncbi:MAG: TlpA disulfide reductase family protein [Thermodesulfovibrionia bacterium]
MKKKIFVLIMSALLFSSLLVYPHFISASDEKPYKKAPHFTLSDIKGKSVSLSDFKGKVILIDFWATWCRFCRLSIPMFASLYDEYRDKGFEVIGIALEYDGGKKLKIFAKENRIPYTLLVGSEKLARKYLAFGVPTRFLINRKGEIVKRFIGVSDRDIFESAIKKLLFSD